MTRKLISLFLVVSVLFCAVPVYAADGVDSSYLNWENLEQVHISSSNVDSGFYSFINNYKDNYDVYLVPVVDNQNSGDSTVYGLKLFAVSGYSVKYYIFANNFSSFDNNYQKIRFHKDGNTLSFFTVPTYAMYFYTPVRNETINRDYSNPVFADIHTFSDNDFLLFSEGECVNKYFCSEEVEDYEENGVHITGLVKFFNNMTNKMNEIVESIKNLVSDILGIPEDGYFLNKINEIKDTLNEKYNIDALLSFFSDMQNVDAVNPSVETTQNLTVNNSTIPFNFAVRFDWFDGSIKAAIQLLLRAVVYPTMIIYNLNQFYLLFRGRKFFDNGGEEE